MDDLRTFVEQDAFARYLGVELLEYGEGGATAGLTVRRHHLNSAGTLHGGAIFALADAAFSAASNSRGVLAASIEASISYFRAVSQGTVTARAREVACNPKLGTYLIDVTDESGDLIAQFRGTVYRRSTAIAEAVGR